LLFFSCLGLRAEIREEGKENVQRFTTSDLGLCMFGVSEDRGERCVHRINLTRFWVVNKDRGLLLSIL
jgi:hypothetical protein